MRSIFIYLLCYVNITIAQPLSTDFKGKVVDAKTKKGIPNVKISAAIHDKKGNNSITDIEKTDTNGIFLIRDWPTENIGGPLIIQYNIIHEGYEDKTDYLKLSKGTPILSEPILLKPIPIKQFMEPKSFQFQGQIRSLKKGAPLENVKITYSFIENFSEKGIIFRESLTDENGFFRFHSPFDTIPNNLYGRKIYSKINYPPFYRDVHYEFTTPSNHLFHPIYINENKNNHFGLISGITAGVLLSASLITKIVSNQRYNEYETRSNSENTKNKLYNKANFLNKVSIVTGTFGIVCGATFTFSLFERKNFPKDIIFNSPIIR